MISDQLRAAREYEEANAPTIPEEDRPAFHVTGGIGWINDPNGFSVYRGEYHLFFQYHPFGNDWGPMHWGHVKTKDFIRWERLPIALAPDRPVDREGCYSGSALELPDGRHLLVYTGVSRVPDEDGVLREYQQQCIAFGDGVEYTKYEGDPVVSAALLPEDGSPSDFRDPKLWRENDTYYMVVANRTDDGSGAIRLFESADVLHWRYVSTVDASRNELGRMWECPDLFLLDGKDVLIVNPQELEAQGLELHAGCCTVAMIGCMDAETKTLRREMMHSVDYGIDFYAPQTLLTPDGRRIMISWMQSWANVGCKPEGARFFGQMTLPCELSLRDGRLCRVPVRELEGYHGRCVRLKAVPVSGRIAPDGLRGRLIDMTISVRPAEDGHSYRTVVVRVAADARYETLIRYEPVNGILHVDRTHSGFRSDIVHVRDIPVRDRGGRLELRIVMDRNTLELFVNEGEQAASFMLYTPLTADGITLEATEGTAILDVELYELSFER